ncbi:MAG TPA: FAD-dependent oxidoreductase [Thermoprotei archaeon]|nr:FAD-dependent oxidoreductase [Thermoprotei archaeon]
MRVIVVGSGIAGLSAYLRLKEQGFDVLALTAQFSGGSSWKAQGGVAVPLGEEDVESHIKDTLTAGKGLCDESVVRYVVRAGMSVMRWITSLGFNPATERSMEAGHSRARVVRGKAADDIGAELMSVLTKAAGKLETARAIRVDTNGEKVVGLQTDREYLTADAVVLATGGYSGLYEYSTNDGDGSGIAIALNAGALVRDMEFVQFHPTVAFLGGQPFLLTEALRGEGATLVNDGGEAFMKRYDPRGDLATRDVVAKAIFEEIKEGRRVYLDLSRVKDVRVKFPNVTNYLARHGLDPDEDLVEVSPAAHFTMGGVATDALGRSSVRGLFAIGEAGNALMHGANRLASNSILQALVQGYSCPDAIRRYCEGIWLEADIGSPSPGHGDVILVSAEVDVAGNVTALEKKIMWQEVGIVRSEGGLERAAGELKGIGRLVAVSALSRKDSVGAHQRSDYPNPPPFPYHVYVKVKATD